MSGVRVARVATVEAVRNRSISTVDEYVGSHFEKLAEGVKCVFNGLLKDC
jgi:hypothetical protein